VKERFPVATLSSNSQTNFSKVQFCSSHPSAEDNAVNLPQGEKAVNCVKRENNINFIIPYTSYEDKEKWADDEDAPHQR
jgi:hypothetical protein